MATARQAFDGSNGAAPGTYTGYWTWSWEDPPGSSALLSTAQSLSGGSSLRATSTTTRANYTATGTLLTHYHSQFMYLTAAPSASFAVHMLAGDAYTLNHNVGITTDRRVYAITGAYGYNAATDTALTNGGTNTSAANVVPLNEWFRVDTTITANSSTINLYVASGSGGIYSTGAAHYSATVTGGSSFSSASVWRVGAVSHSGADWRTFISSSNYVYVEALASSDTSMPAPPFVIGNASFASTAGLSASAVIPTTSGAAFASTADLSASATLAYPVDASFASTAGLSASAVFPVVAGASLSATAGFSADAEVSEIVTADAALAGVGALTSGAYLDSEIAPGYLFGSVAPNPVTGG